MTHAKSRQSESPAPRAVAPGDAPRPGLVWIPANAAGFAVGFTAWEAIFPALRPVVSRPLGGFLNIAFLGAALGICAGLAQWGGLWLHHARAGAWWCAAAVVSYALGFVAGAWASDALTRAFGGGVSVYLSDAVEDLTFGILLGLAVGLGRGLVLRRAAPSGAAWWWIVASAAALAVGYASTLGITQVLPPYPEPLLGAIFGLFAGAITGLVEWLIMGRRVRASIGRAA